MRSCGCSDCRLASRRQEVAVSIATYRQPQKDIAINNTTIANLLLCGVARECSHEVRGVIPGAVLRIRLDPIRSAVFTRSYAPSYHDLNTIYNSCNLNRGAQTCTPSDHSTQASFPGPSPLSQSAPRGLFLLQSFKGFTLLVPPTITDRDSQRRSPSLNDEFLTW